MDLNQSQNNHSGSGDSGTGLSDKNSKENNMNDVQLDEEQFQKNSVGSNENTILLPEQNNKETNMNYDKTYHNQVELYILNDGDRNSLLKSIGSSKSTDPPPEHGNKESNTANMKTDQTKLQDNCRSSCESGTETYDNNNTNSNMDHITDRVLRKQLSQPSLVNNLNSLLADIHKRYVAINRDEFQTYYLVYQKVISPLHDAMKKVDSYYNRYSSRVQFAGSHYDRLRIDKPDEFDVDMVIGLPVSMKLNKIRPEDSDIIIEPKCPGFVQLRAGTQYKNIAFRDGAECAINVQAYKWLDKQDYITRSRFTDWFKSVVSKALNTFDKTDRYPSIVIDGVLYTIENSTSGPAFTLFIKNSAGFKLDVDLVPAIRFPEDRWPVCKTYREIPTKNKADYWMVVPKPNKNGTDSRDEDRSWRVAMHDQERKMIHGSYNMRTINRLLKKLRDAQGMNYIASYYVKTLFLWKTLEKDGSYWQQDMATLFKDMVTEFHLALINKKIKYFWNQNNNMIERVPEHILRGYANKLNNLISKLQSDYMLAAKFLLTANEYSQYASSRLAIEADTTQSVVNNKKKTNTAVINLEQNQAENNPTASEVNTAQPNIKNTISTVDNIADQLSRMLLSQPAAVNNLNSLLADIHKRYVAINRDEFQKYYRVYEKVINPLQDAMKKVDPYYGRYSSRVQFAGSHYDRDKPDEFEVEIVIGLPVSMKLNKIRPEDSDIIIEPKCPGFVQLRAGTQYKNIVIREGAECALKVQAYKWLDKQDYISRSRFTDWFKSVVSEALNTFDKTDRYPSIVIDGVVYTIEISTSGPAFTLIIKNSAGFKLDVNFVPAIRFPEDRWPVCITYREITAKNKADYWMVVPKPNKNGTDIRDEDRSWRVAMHDQERKMIHGSYNMRTINRLLKKLRDAQGMNYIASYYVKTLFLWKTLEKDGSYWQQDMATLFKDMVTEFHLALINKKIKYFWNQNNNMIERVPEHILRGYANKLNNLISKLQSDYMLAAKFLLTADEYSQYINDINISQCNSPQHAASNSIPVEESATLPVQWLMTSSMAQSATNCP